MRSAAQNETEEFLLISDDLIIPIYIDTSALLDLLAQKMLLICY